MEYNNRVRISDKFPDYELFPFKLDSNNFDQNEIGDCHFISIVALISKEENLIKRLFPVTKNPYGYYK